MAIAARKAGSSTAVQVILSVGGTFVFQRPKPLGSDPREDAFESMWHMAALGLLQGLGAAQPSLAGLQDRYLDALSKRYNGLAFASGNPLSRFNLDRAIARAQQCCTQLAFNEFENYEGRNNPSMGRGLDAWGRYDASRLRADLSKTINLFDGASRHSEVRSEAVVRGAYLLLHAGEPARAAQVLNEIHEDADQTDRELQYWIYLVRAQVSDVLTRFTEAIQDYRNALNVSPGAHSAQVGLAIDLMRTGRRSEGVAVASAASTDARGMPDPWWTFDAADERFVTNWRDQLRKADW
jgi:tetratricopeptide (TPR) repeat protein